MARLHYLKRWYEIQATNEILKGAGYTFEFIYGQAIENVYYISEETFKKTIYKRNTDSLNFDEKAAIHNRVYKNLICRKFIRLGGGMVLE